MASARKVAWTRRLGQRLAGCGLAQLALVLVAACGFPRPEAIRDDSGPVGCTRDQDCGGATPYCLGTACVACSSNASCPAVRPVCETTSYDCRSCVKDGECDSGACDLAAGTCVEQGAILYVSPQGEAAAPCTQSAPCSLQQAIELTNEKRYYIVMSSGRYSSEAGMTYRNLKTVFFIGNQSFLSIPGSGTIISFAGCSSITFRNVNIEEHDGSSDFFDAVVASSCDVTIDGMHAITERFHPISVFESKLTIRHSEFRGPPVRAARLAADDCIFYDNGPTITTAGELTNSIIIAAPGQQAIWLPRPPDGTQFSTKIAHNTFIGGVAGCEESAFEHHFDSNIFYNQTQITTGSFCTYDYNLIIGNSVISGGTNIMGDPKFKDVANNDFHLTPGSPAIDAANPANLVTRDFGGMMRPQGARSDIGAFEYVP